MNNQGLEDQALLLETFGAKVDEGAYFRVWGPQITQIIRMEVMSE